MIPGERVSLQEARTRANLSEASMAESVAALTAVFPGLTTPPGGLELTACPDLIDPQRFCESLPDDMQPRFSNVAIYAVCESTNEEVMAIGLPSVNTCNVALSEYQTGGRGRLGRSWSTGFAGGICLTVARRFAAAERVDPTLTLAVGVQLAGVLDRWLSQPVLLKWPNDLILDDGKLGGILVELSTLPGGDQIMRIGVGINCDLPTITPDSAGVASLPPASLASRARSALDRTQIAADLVAGIVRALDRHREEGFGAFQADWQDRDYLRHQPVQVFSDERVRHGLARGIDEHGALRVETDEGLLTLMSGEVRVRRR